MCENFFDPQIYNCYCQYTTNKNCKKRNFSDNSSKLIKILIEIKKKTLPSITSAILTNSEEFKYKHFNYNGSFHKGLAHNWVDGRLISSNDYEKMKLAIYNGDQNALSSIPLAINSSVKMVNPLASFITLTIGAQQNALCVPDPPSLSSAAGASEMLEVYAQAIARDVPFSNYNFDPIINSLLEKTHLNNIFVRSNLKYAPVTPFTTKNIFRGNSYGDNIGPYISQLLYLDITAGALKVPQKYYVPSTRNEAQIQNYRVEWGINLK